MDQILKWADAHKRWTGTWPNEKSGPISKVPGETWIRVQAALHVGKRGLPVGLSIARLLAEQRGVRNVQGLPPLEVSTILKWIKKHHQRHGKYPTRDSGQIPNSTGETWGAIVSALAVGGRGLGARSSLARLVTGTGCQTSPFAIRMRPARINRQRHPEFRGREREFRIVRGHMHLPGGYRTDLLRVTVEFSPDLAGYDPAQDADLYEYYLAENCGTTQSKPSKIWIEQCEAARGIEDEFGTQKALAYLVAEKFLNYLEAAENDAELRAEIPAYVAEIKTIFEPWQLFECLATARQTEPFDPSIYDDLETAETERKAELRRSAADLLLVERAKEWLLGE